MIKNRRRRKRLIKKRNRIERPAREMRMDAMKAIESIKPDK